MDTVEAQIEIFLTPLSNDPNGLEALTPGHFLAHRPLIAMPELRFLELLENKLSRWQMMQRCKKKDVEAMVNEPSEQLERRNYGSIENGQYSTAQVTIGTRDRDPFREKWIET